MLILELKTFLYYYLLDLLTWGRLDGCAQLLHGSSGPCLEALLFCWVLLCSPNSFNFGCFLIFAGAVFLIGALGVGFNRKNVILLMVCVEVMFLGVNLVFISGYVFLGLDLGLVFALVSLSVAAAEAAVGFSLLTSSFRVLPVIALKRLSRLKG